MDVYRMEARADLNMDSMSGSETEESADRCEALAAAWYQAAALTRIARALETIAQHMDVT